MRKWSIIISLIFILYAYLGGSFHLVAEMIIAFILVGVIGMSHGSIDHILATEVLKILPQKKINYFIAIYIGIIILYVGLWLISPLISFVLFLAYSAYHFGQADTDFITQKLSLITRKVIGFNYGLLILSTLVVANSLYIVSIFPDWFKTIVNSDWVVLLSVYVFAISLLVQVLVLAVLAFNRKINLKHLLNFVIQLVIIFVLFVLLPPLISFSLYFGLWHSLLVLQKEYHAIREAKVVSNAKDFIRKLIPFTFLSLIGLFVIIYLGRANAHFTTLIAISVLAFPHTLLMDRVYNLEARK
jgi:Brp/Blh family beta-carotene 15,15'-monooxygenase